MLEKKIDHSIEVSESWDEFNRCEESELDKLSVDDFVIWNNENRVTQIERISIECCQPNHNMLMLNYLDKKYNKLNQKSYENRNR